MLSYPEEPGSSAAPLITPKCAIAKEMPTNLMVIHIYIRIEPKSGYAVSV
jgi:hypothetical protein